MDINKIAKIVYDESQLHEDAYFDTPIFYYLSARFPDLTIKECTEIVNQIRCQIENRDEVALK